MWVLNRSLYWPYRRLQGESPKFLCELAFCGRAVDRSSPNQVVARECRETGAHNLLNHANTVSVEDNSRKRSYCHSHANMTTSLHAWCRDNRSKRVVA
jgi:hypothetical protein